MVNFDKTQRERESLFLQNSRAKTSISSTDQSVYAPAKT